LTIKKKVLKYTIRTNELNLTSRTELFVNFKRAELELKKLVRFKLESSFEPSQFLSSQVELRQVRLDSTRLISNPNTKES